MILIYASQTNYFFFFFPPATSNLSYGAPGGRQTPDPPSVNPELRSHLLYFCIQAKTPWNNNATTSHPPARGQMLPIVLATVHLKEFLFFFFCIPSKKKERIKSNVLETCFFLLLSFPSEGKIRKTILFSEGNCYLEN